jgi:hypothetical protein
MIDDEDQHLGSSFDGPDTSRLYKRALLPHNLISIQWNLIPC